MGTIRFSEGGGDRPNQGGQGVNGERWKAFSKSCKKDWGHFVGGGQGSGRGWMSLESGVEKRCRGRIHEKSVKGGGRRRKLGTEKKNSDWVGGPLLKNG